MVTFLLARRVDASPRWLRHGLGSETNRSERPNYSQQIVRSSDEQMLLNLVWLRYDDTLMIRNKPASRSKNRRSKVEHPLK